MSTLLAPKYTEVDKIPLGQRIEEIKKEKGGYYSNVAMAGRLGIHTETLRLMLKGKREIYTFELEKIAKDLKLPIDRIMQSDIRNQTDELNELLRKRTKEMLQRAWVIVNELVAGAMGLSEKGNSLNSLAKVQYFQRSFDDAHTTWLKALEYAKKLHEQYAKKHLLNIVTANLMMTYSIRKEYSHLEELLDVVELAFANDPLKMGMAEYTRMKIQEERGDYELAKQHAHRSFKYFEETGSNEQIGNGLINLAHCEYRLGNYRASANALAEAIEFVKPFENILILAVKEYVKSLMQLRDYPTVVKMVEAYHTLALEYPDYWAKLQIMYTFAKDDPSYAERIACDLHLDVNIRYHACKSLMEFYSEKRDFESVVRYYEKSRLLMDKKRTFLNEEGF